jgi:hypothetical protein
MNRAIFRSTSQALHFAYLIEAYEVSVPSGMAQIMRQAMQQAGGDALGTSASIDFGGLNPLEVRAQCAMIRGIVRDRLPLPEASAIQARYGLNEIALSDGRRRPVFSRERYQAILKLGDWLAPSFPNFNPLAVDILIARAVDKRVADISFRQMAEKFGLDQSTYAYALKRVHSKLSELENMAIDRLQPSFMADGVVADFMTFA